MRFLVTGATGHIGANLCRVLLGAGHTVVALARPTSDRRGLVGLDLQVALGDLGDPDSIRAAMTGVDGVFHLAARYQVQGVTLDEVRGPAVDGTRVVLEAAADAGVQRVVFTSTTGAVGSTWTGSPLLDESHWHDDPKTSYFQVKREAEEMAWTLARASDLDMVVVNPGAVTGQYDYRITPSTSLMRGMIEGGLPTVQGGASVVDVRDVAQAQLAAMERGRGGERYILAGENITIRQLGQAIAEVSGLWVPHAPMPRPMIPLMMPVLGRSLRAMGYRDTLSVDEADEFVGRYLWYDTQKAREELGFDPRPPAAIIDHTLRWLVHIEALSPGRMARLAPRFTPDPAWVAPR